MSLMMASEAQTTAQYINDFLDLVEEVPNEVQRHLSQLHQLNSTYLRIVDRTEHVVNKYKLVVQSLAAANGFCHDRDGLRQSRLMLSKKLETQLIQIQELSDEKLRYSQMIFDLIESKAKELDLDYEEVIEFSEKIMDNKSLNRINASDKSMTNAVHNGCTVIKSEMNDKKKEEVEDICQMDKRWLPRRACAVKNGHISDALSNTDDRSDGHTVRIRPTSGRVVHNKSIKGKNFTKSHSFGLSMSTFYRQMAKRRVKQIPQKANKLSAKSGGHSVQSKTSNRNKNNENSSNKSDNKAPNSSNSVEHVVRKKSILTTRRNSSSSGSDSGSVKDNKGCDNRNSNAKSNSHKNSHNLKRESSKRSSAQRQQSSSSMKKSKCEWSSASATDNFYGEPIDPNEPTYCLCDQVSFGQMICCDNERCAIEWFHFPCVGLDTKPKGKWYCPHCRKAPRIHNLAKHKNN